MARKKSFEEYREENLREQEKIKQQIEDARLKQLQAEHCIQRAENQIAYQRKKKDKARVHRLIKKGAAIEAICNNPSALTAYNNIIGKYKNMNVCVILGGVENVSIPYNAPEILKKAKDERKLLLFDDVENIKVFDIPYGSIKKYKKALEIGDCYFIKGNDCIKLKTPKCL